MNKITYHPSFQQGTINTTTAAALPIIQLVFGLFRSSYPLAGGARASMRPLLDSSTTNASRGLVNIMKGTPPESPEELYTHSSRSDDILVQFACTTTAAVFTPSLPLSGTVITDTNATSTFAVSSVYTAAAASGEATWVWICNQATPTASTTTDVVYHSVIGTVGDMASGADLVIPNVNIVKDKLYRIVNMKLTAPLEISY